MEETTDSNVFFCLFCTLTISTASDLKTHLLTHFTSFAESAENSDWVSQHIKYQILLNKSMKREVCGIPDRLRVLYKGLSHVRRDN